jgi:hypothetical protein
MRAFRYLAKDGKWAAMMGSVHIFTAHRRGAKNALRSCAANPDGARWRG